MTPITDTSPTSRTPRTAPAAGVRTLRAVAASAAAVALAAGLSACGTADAATTSGSGADGTTTLRYQGSAGSVTYPELAQDLGYFTDVDLEWVGDSTSGPASIQAAVTGDTDYGNAFNGAIANLAASGAKITSVVSYYGADDKTATGYYTLAGSPITEPKDLIGTKVGVNTLGGEYEFVLREWLARGGLTRDEIDKVQLVVVPPANTEQALRQKQIDVAALPNVLQDIAVDHGGVTPLFTEDELFDSFALGSIVFRDDFVAEHEDAVRDFVQGTARAIRWAQTTPVDEVQDRFRTILTERGRGEPTTYVDYWKSSSIPAAGGVIDPDEISIWVDWLVKDGQLTKGQIDPDDLFTNDFNPYANGTYPADSGPDGEKVAS
ncbi:ABC transporter substrate-binding protein [Cellulomonas sp. PhB143]|uniref:ABC transporter substrate-binding protein n=1 Tax=Cellulomonas sp. PhB143 TaxID=2485186 RepID=UPI000F46E60D|nr:ABC transporter substrate-binding protein [Cellulomonas sp. PhB143]ROS75445.1 ABC-type nitrate/sulfonate/bicarbonate transport system substrate-binding protein [Cellulomonas sp. PhB143]